LNRPLLRICLPLMSEPSIASPDRQKPHGPVNLELDVAGQMAAAYEAAQKGDYPAALAIWGPLAHASVARAQNNVGACFAEGLGVERDNTLALRWLTLAAEEGDPVGQRNLAALYSRVRA
jgi:TPR repeat protein